MRTSILALGALLSLAALRPGIAAAHCDGLDGPVVTAARGALESGRVEPVLAWVPMADEAEIRQAFERTLAVRRLSLKAKELADLYFFETLVRVHRAAEGAPYTGLAAAGRDLGPAIPAADRALRTGSLEPLERLLTEHAQRGLRARFEEAYARKDFEAGDVKAARGYVGAYVAFVHYVERLYQATRVPAHGHYAETQPAEAHEGHAPPERLNP